MNRGIRLLVALLSLGILVVGAWITRAGDKSVVQTQLNGRYEAQVESSLVNAAVAEETFFTDADTYTQDVEQLLERGFQPAEGVSMVVLSANEEAYCLQATHELLPPDHPFKVATYDSLEGRPVAKDECG